MQTINTVGIVGLLAPAIVVFFRSQLADSRQDEIAINEFMTTWAGLMALAVPVICVIFASQNLMSFGHVLSFTMLAASVALYCLLVKNAFRLRFVVLAVFAGAMAVSSCSSAQGFDLEAAACPGARMVTSKYCAQEV